MVKILSGGIANSGLYRHYFTFGGVSTYNYDCICDGHETFSPPRHVYEEITVPGRNGKLYYDSGYFENVDIKFTMFFTDVKEYMDFINKLLSFQGYQRLEDSHHPGEYRLAMLVSDISPEVSGYDNEYCSLELTFTAKPQRFLLNGEYEKTLSSSGAILYNPTLYSAKPLIKVYCSSSVTNFTLNGYPVRVNNGNPYNYICMDCETMDSYNGTTNLNNRIVCNNYPILKPGDNVLTATSGLNKLVITPRWWKV